ncbi:MAG TPA: hypothetical protein VFP95_03460 [Gammaproteobacteria bacterium]|nr:hypothetical protein [Gammaproteobacteria bacterium]
MHKALKAAAVKRGTTISLLVQESLEAYGIKPEADIHKLVAAARAHSNLTTAEAERLAVAEARREK